VLKNWLRSPAVPLRLSIGKGAALPVFLWRLAPHNVAEISSTCAAALFTREALEDFGKTLPALKHYGALIYPNMEREHAAYENIKQDGEPVRSLHHAMNSKVKPAADFFVETCIIFFNRSSSG